MNAGPAYHALIICWRGGQRSPIHDHVGSNCAVKVLRGVATETIFERGPNGMIYATGSRILNAGEVCASADSDIHQVSNLEANENDLITLHLYSPPLISMNVYSLIGSGIRKFLDPINEDFSAGSGI
jgi:cysteine dioxygenase